MSATRNMIRRLVAEADAQAAAQHVPTPTLRPTPVIVYAVPGPSASEKVEAAERSEESKYSHSNRAHR